MDQEAAASPRVLAARQALSLQELTTRKQELLSELQGYQVHRIPGTVHSIPGTVQSIPDVVPVTYTQHRVAPHVSKVAGKY